MYRTVKKNILIVILGLGLVPFQGFSMFDKVKDKFTPKFASMDKETLKRVDQLLHTAPQIVNQITQQLNEILQGSNELRTLKKVLHEVNALLHEMDEFSKHSVDRKKIVKKELASTGFPEKIQSLIIDYTNPLPYENESKERKESEYLIEAQKEEEFRTFYVEKIKPSLESVNISLNALLKQINTMPHDVQIEEVHRKNREQRAKSIDQLCKNLHQFKELIGMDNSLGLEPKSSTSFKLPMSDLTIIQEGLLQFKSELEKTIDQFRKNSFGGGVYESLDNTIKELTDGLNDVVRNFSQSVSADFKEVIGFPVLLNIRKKLSILMSNQPSQETIRSSLQDIMIVLVDFIGTLQEGSLHDQLVTFNGQLQSLFDIRSISNEELKRLDNELEQMLISRNGLLGTLTTIADEMKEKLNVVVDRFNEHNIKLIDNNVPRAGKRIMCYVPFIATATLSALWLTHQFFNDQLDQGKFIKSSSVFAASLAALPCVDYVMNFFAQNKKAAKK